MAPRAKKPAAKKAGITRSKTAAGAAVGQQSSDAAKKPAFGKAAPRRVETTAQPAAAKKKTVAAKAGKDGDPSLATKIVHVATGAVVAGAKGAASLVASVAGKKTGTKK